MEVYTVYSVHVWERDLGVVGGSVQDTVSDVFVRLRLTRHHLHHKGLQHGGEMGNECRRLITTGTHTYQNSVYIHREEKRL